MRSLILGAAVAVCVALTGCEVTFNSLGPPITGSGRGVTELRDLEAFEKISLKAPADVFVTIGDEQSVELEVDDNLVDVITTEVRSGRLEIGANKNFKTDLGVVLRITVPKLQAATVTGSGKVLVETLDCDRFEGKVTGSGDLKASGKAKRVEATVTGSGDLDFSDLQAEEAEAKVTGSGDLMLSASKKVKARVTGSGDITYQGHSGAMPNVESKITGSGDIRRK